MTSFKEFCDHRCCSQAGHNNLGGFGSLSSFRPSYAFSFYQDQCQDVPLPVYGNMGNVAQGCGGISGTIYTSPTGDITMRLAGKLGRLLRSLGFAGNLDNFGSFESCVPISIQFGERAL